MDLRDGANQALKAGVTVIQTKGQKKDRIGVIQRRVNHGWFHVIWTPDGDATMHNSYLSVATPEQIRAGVKVKTVLSFPGDPDLPLF